MPYDFSDFSNKQPYDFHLCRFDDDGTERGVFAARWQASDFQDDLEFQVFLFKYSGLLQPYICGKRDAELESWFAPDEAAESSAIAYHKSHKVVDLDAKDWLERKLSFATIPWLEKGQHLKAMELTVDEFPELVAFGDAGYLTVFVADLIG
jgi:hypothetical protein